MFNLAGSKDGFFEFFLPTAHDAASVLAPNITVNSFRSAILHPPEESTSNQEFSNEGVTSSEPFDHNEAVILSEEHNHNEDISPGEEYEGHNASAEASDHSDEIHG